MSDLIRIAPTADGGLTADRASMPALSDVPDLGISYAEVGVLPEAGLTFARGQVPPAGVVPNHAGPNSYALFVVAGQGELILYDANGAESDRIAYAPGCLILFPPDAAHGWVNAGEADFEWFGVDIAARS